MNTTCRLVIISQALKELPADQQEAFLLHVVCRIGLDEVGKEMRISRRAAAIHVARAMMYIQRRLDENDA